MSEMDTLDFSNVVRVFLPFFTYPVTSSILHLFGNEDTIFDPCITINHFYSFKPGLSHRCGTFKKFDTHRSQPMLKSSYKAKASVIISIPPLVGGVADVVVEIKGTGWSISITFRFSVGLQTPDDLSRSRLRFIEKMGVHG
nr:hypothetical protein [Tanacetum cinerariifolium]